jgi:glucose/arabinose dehydrogenase
VLHESRARRGALNRVSRLTYRDGGAANETGVLDMPGTVAGHNGCRLKFGPDGKLYVSMGDVTRPELAQYAGSLAGKILRVNSDGSVPADNPFAGSPVYALGLRNPQGLAWDGKGRLIASDHGSTGHDEINHIRPGANYGWPRVAGQAGDARYVDPIIESGLETWAPSGIAIRGDDLFVTGLRSQRLWRITLGPDLEITRVSALLEGTYGRLRDVVVGPDGALYVATSNGDGGGTERPGNNRILKGTP